LAWAAVRFIVANRPRGVKAASGSTGDTSCLDPVILRRKPAGSPRVIAHPGLPQIRTCALNASGSSRWGIAVPHTTGWFRGDTLVRHEVLSVVPTRRPQRGTPFAPRGPEGPFPRFSTTMGHCDSLPSVSPHFVSFVWRYHRFVRRSSPSASDVGRGSTWSW